jgi:hypothetical protein
VLAHRLQKVAVIRSNLSALKEIVMLPTTVDRVPNQTNQEINDRIRRQTEQRIAKLKHAGAVAIERRLQELDAEWDIERLLEANAATASLIGLTLGTTVDKRWFILPGVVATFLLQHALQGWCPPLPVFRRLGVRTAREIDYERYALKAIRGDFEDIVKQKRHGGYKVADQALRAAEA